MAIGAPSDDHCALRPGFGPLEQSPSGMRMWRVTRTGTTARAPVEMCRFELPPGAQSPRDAHEEAEVWMIAGGRGELTVNGTTVLTAQAGDVFAFEPQTSHTILNVGSELLVVFSCWWREGP